jgi:2-methylisocitrate lyase-like PEP mutase family enzyme
MLAGGASGGQTGVTCMTERQRPNLRPRLARKELLVAPGVFDGISARIADGMGFEALYMTGYGTVASHLGLPDAGIATYSDMVSRVAVLAKGTTTPLIADGDTGYGGLLNVQYSVRGYEAAGAGAIQLEDQEFPKKCGHMLGRRVVPTEDMVDKIKVAVGSRDSSDFLIIARTDARTTLGLDEALRRADAYSKAGADILFVESPESIEEMRIIGRSFDRPLMANMVEGGRTPIADRKTLEEIGYSVAIFPAFGFLAAGEALRGAYRHLREHGSSVGGNVPLYKFSEFSELMGFDAIAKFDKTYGRRSP